VFRTRSRALAAALTMSTFAATSLIGCADDPANGAQELDDTQWIGSNSFEVNSVFSSTLTHEASGEWSDLATDEELQAALIATHITYGKKSLERDGYWLNLMPDAILSVEVSVDGDLVSLTYEASVDMVRKKGSGQENPTLEDLPKTHLEVTIPADPVDVNSRAGKTCASDYGSYTLTEYKYFYYFNPNTGECELPMISAAVDIKSVYPQPKSYPEYDRLLGDLDDGTRGFRAAILPNRGDNDPMSRFDAHKSALDRITEMAPEDGGSFQRYRWTEDGATIVIDLFDPTQGYFPDTFQNALGEYQLVFYNGHSNYGHQPFLQNTEAYSDEYQILGMHSCQSYAYYVSQMVAGKVTAEDPTGFVNSDMIATGRSSYPSDSPDVMAVLLEGLMSGITVVANDKNQLAPSWQDIGNRMMNVAPSILYGVAGARLNEWRPSVPDEPVAACAHVQCETGAILDSRCDPCVAQIIEADIYCGETFWDGACVDQVATVCGATCE